MRQVRNERSGVSARRPSCPGRRLDARAREAGVLVVAACLALACANANQPSQPLPRHPFPVWVSGLQPGLSETEDVIARFGEPDEIEESVRGGTLWRYSLPELHWADSDPARPEVSADGRLLPPKPSPLAPIFAVFEQVGDFVGRLILYPGTQPRPPRRRAMPATLHLLELRFAPDGTLERHHYTTEPGRVMVPVES